MFLPHNGRIIHESEVQSLIRKYDLFENNLNPKVTFRCCLMQTAEDDTAVDLATGIRWQFAGSEIGSFHQLHTWMAGINQAGLACFHDWRLPTIEEALSLLRGEKGEHGAYIHQCFSIKQGYIYTADRRKPGVVSYSC